jgi:hypothetical protein
MFRPPRGSLGSFSFQEEDDEEEFDIFNPMPFVVQPIQDVPPTEAQLREAALPADWEERIISVNDTINFSLLISGWLRAENPLREDHFVWFRGNKTMDLILERLDIYLEDESHIMRYQAEGRFWMDGHQVSEDVFVALLVQ